MYETLREKVEHTMCPFPATHMKREAEKNGYAVRYHALSDSSSWDVSINGEQRGIFIRCLPFTEMKYIVMIPDKALEDIARKYVSEIIHINETKNAID